MKQTLKRAVILIPRLMPTENLSANHHLYSTDHTTMKMIEASSCSSDDLEKMMMLKGETTRLLPTDSTTTGGIPLFREPSTGSSDTDDSHASMKVEVDDSSNDDQDIESKQQQEQMCGQESSMDKMEQDLIKPEEEEEEEPIIKRTRSSTKRVHVQQKDNNDSDSEAVDHEQDDKETDDDDEEEDNENKELDTKVVKKGILLRQEESEEEPLVDDNDQGYIYKCAKCPHRTTDFMSLMKHRQTLHSGRGYEGTSIKHMRLIPLLNDPNHYCRACERKFSTANTYLNHLQMVHHISDPSTIPMTMMNDSNGTHQSTISNTSDDPQALQQQQPLTCRFCSQGFDSRLALTRHQINDHKKRNNGKKARCLDCKIDYKSTREYLQHRRLEHNNNNNNKASSDDVDMKDAPTNQKQVTCKLCGMEFDTIRMHLAHFNREHRDYTKKAATKLDMVDITSQSLPKLRTRRKSKTKTVRFLLPDPADLPSSSKDTPLQCYTCMAEFENRPDLTRHMASVHRQKEQPTPLDKEKESITDQYRCRSCLVQCESRSALKDHLSSVHNNFDNRSPKKKKSNHQPNKSAIQFECSICLTVCEGRSALSSHLWTEHHDRMRGKKKKTMEKDTDPLMQDTTPTDDEDHEDTIPQQQEEENYCKACQKTFKNWLSYRSHLYNKHRDTILKRANNNPKTNTEGIFGTTLSKSPTSIVEPLLPDINNPNFYCRVCDKTLPTKSNFYSHILASHSNYDPKDPSLPQPETTTTTPSKKRTAMLDVDDPNYHCTLCDRTFDNQPTFYQHLRSKHYIKRRLNNNNTTPTTTPTTTANKHSTPDATSGSYGKHLCTICQQRQVTLGHHRQHLRLAHKVKLPPVNRSVIKFRYPDALIDINSPDFYCAQCDHFFTSKPFFLKHVEGVHDMS